MNFAGHILFLVFRRGCAFRIFRFALRARFFGFFALPKKNSELGLWASLSASPVGYLRFVIADVNQTKLFYFSILLASPKKQTKH